MERKGQENLGESSATETTPVTSKRPYKASRLKHLGSDRELTLGATMGPFGDGATGMMLSPM